jgi:hypothetical protein
MQNGKNYSHRYTPMDTDCGDEYPISQTNQEPHEICIDQGDGLLYFYNPQACSLHSSQAVRIEFTGAISCKNPLRGRGGKGGRSKLAL